MTANMDLLVGRIRVSSEVHKLHTGRLRLDWDGIHRCPACDPEPPRLVRVSQVVPGCWQVWCRRCAMGDVGLVTQVAMWERAMWRAGEHVREAHSPPNDAVLASEGQVAAACRALYNQWTWGWVRHGERPDPQRLHHELYCAVLGEVVQDG